MHIGVGKKTLLVVTIALLTIVSGACAQSKKDKDMIFKEHRAKAVKLRENGDVQGAIQENLKAIELNKEDVGIWVNMNRFYLDANELDNAKKAAEKAIELDPNEPWAHYSYGETLIQLGDKRKALEQYKEAVRLAPDYAPILVNTGVLYGDLDDKQKERELYERAIKADPKYASAYYNLAILEEEKGDINKAITLFDKAIDLEPEDTDRVNRAKEKIEKLKSLQKKP